MAHNDPKTRNMSKQQKARLPHYDEQGNLKPEFRGQGNRGGNRGGGGAQRKTQARGGSSMRRRR